MINLAMIMCTRGRPDAAMRFLVGLGSLQLPDVPVRLILVDNNDGPDLKPVLDVADTPFPVDYVHEGRKGLSRARNAGNRALRPGEIAVLVDDDVVLPDTFLQDVLAALEKWPRAGLIGGRVELHNPLDLPIVIKTSREQEVFSNRTPIFGFIHGACMILPAAKIDEIGGFDEKMGAGTPVQSGEDCDYYYRIYRSGSDVVYEPDVWVAHDHGRRTTDEHLQMIRSWTLGQGAFFLKHLLARDREAIKRLWWKFHEDRKAEIAGRPHELKGLIEGAGLYLKALLRG